MDKLIELLTKKNINFVVINNKVKVLGLSVLLINGREPVIMQAGCIRFDLKDHMQLPIDIFDALIDREKINIDWQQYDDIINIPNLYIIFNNKTVTVKQEGISEPILEIKL